MTLRARYLPLLLLPLACAARADIYTCRTAEGGLSIQDKPCRRGAQEKVYRDAPASRRPAAPASARTRTSNGSSPAATQAEKRGIAIGLTAPGNRDVICNLLSQERSDAQAQVAGRASAPPGEDPADNLRKIERQIQRVGCTA